MPKRKLTKHEDDIRRGLRSPDAPAPYDDIHTCSKGCKKPGCNRTLRDTIEEQDRQILALKRDVLEHASKARALDEFMQRFDGILYAHNCKGGANETHAKLDQLRWDYINWKIPQEEQGL